MKYLSGFIVLGVIFGLFAFISMYKMDNVMPTQEEAFTMSAALVAAAVILPVTTAVFIAVHLVETKKIIGKVKELLK